jgi:hypothetical protein
MKKKALGSQQTLFKQEKNDKKVQHIEAEMR